MAKTTTCVIFGGSEGCHSICTGQGQTVLLACVSTFWSLVKYKSAPVASLRAHGCDVTRMAMACKCKRMMLLSVQMISKKIC